MIPIVTFDDNAKDKRKNKSLSWKEARLSITHEKDSITPKLDAVFQGTVDDAGQSWGGEKETDFDSFQIEIMYNISSNNAYLNRDK